MSILPVQAQQKLSASQVAAFDRQYTQATSLIAGATAAPAAASDTLFVSLDAQVALLQFEQAKGASVTDPTQSNTANLVQSFAAPAATTPAFDFTSLDQQTQLLQYVAAQQAAQPPAPSTTG
jgi:hypothetical protein